MRWGEGLRAGEDNTRAANVCTYAVAAPEDAGGREANANTHRLGEPTEGNDHDQDGMRHICAPRGNPFARPSNSLSLPLYQQRFLLSFSLHKNAAVLNSAVSIALFKSKIVPSHRYISFF